MAKHTVKQVPGAKRVSDRIYTHAIIGRWDNAKSLVNLESDIEKRQREWTSNYEYYIEVERLGAGGQYQLHGCNFPVSESSYNETIKILDKHGRDKAAHLASLADEMRADYAKRYNGEAALVVLQWSMSRANANKALGKWMDSYKDVDVVTVDRC